MAERRISDLPGEIIRHILSFLPTDVAAKTSCLLKGWRNEFVHTSNLEFEFQQELGRDEHTFIAFVTRVLALRGNVLPLQRFSLMLNGDIDEAHANSWITSVLGCGVADLELCFYELNELGYQLPQDIFLIDMLRKLKIGCSDSQIIPLDGQVNLPNLRTLYVENVDFGENGAGFYNLLNGCPVLEDLVMEDIEWYRWENCRVSSQTLTRVKIFWTDNAAEHDRENCPNTVSFVTPNLLYLEYSDDIARNYPDMNFNSLVGAKVLLHMREGEEEEEENNEEDASGFIEGIRNVEKLYLCVDTLEVLAFRCAEIPVFHKLSQLTIESSPLVVWESLPNLLIQCPQLHTLVFRGLAHVLSADTCGNVCRCNGLEIPPSCLLTSPVRVLKIFEMGQANNEHQETFLTQARHFLVKMPNLEKLTVYCDASVDEAARAHLSRTLRGIPNKASPMCRIQVLPDNP